MQRLIGLINPNTVSELSSENINTIVLSVNLLPARKYEIPVKAISSKTTENFVIVTAVE